MHAAWRLHSHRQQRLADQHDVASVHADVRSQSDHRGEGGAVRLRLRAVDDQAAWLRRPVAVLGLQPRVVHTDGGARIRDTAHSALCDVRCAHHAAADRRANGGDHRQHLARPLRGEHHLGLAAAGVHADGPLARRRALQAALPVLRRVRHHHARAVGDGARIWRRSPIATRKPRTIPRPTSTASRTGARCWAATSCQPTRASLSAPAPTWRACWTRCRRCPACGA